MRYFVGYGSRAFDTKWLLSGMPPEEGDVAFLVASAKAGVVLVGLFTIGELEEFVAATAVVPASSFRLPELLVPAQLLPDPVEQHRGADDNVRWLYPVDEDVGRTLLKLAQRHLSQKTLPLSSGSKGTRGKGQKPPKEEVRSIEEAARKRLGQANFREALLQVYGGAGVR
jgi:hypothetical protein